MTFHTAKFHDRSFDFLIAILFKIALFSAWIMLLRVIQGNQTFAARIISVKP